MPLHQEMLSENPDIVEVYQEIQKMNEEMRKQVTEYEAAKEASIKAKAIKTKSFTEPMPMSAMEAGLGMEWQSGWEFTENEGMDHGRNKENAKQYGYSVGEPPNFLVRSYGDSGDIPNFGAISV